MQDIRYHYDSGNSFVRSKLEVRTFLSEPVYNGHLLLIKQLLLYDFNSVREKAETNLCVLEQTETGVTS